MRSWLLIKFREVILKSVMLSVVPLLVGCLFLSGCDKPSGHCNPPKQFTDPRTPSLIQHTTLAACEVARPTTCAFANGEVAKTMGRLVGNCNAYCQTPLTENEKACKPVVRNLNTGTGVCEPQALVDDPAYYHIMCENLSVDCSCE